MDEDLRLFLRDYWDSLNAEQALIDKMKRQIELLIGPQMKSENQMALLAELTFNVLVWETEKGPCLGNYEVAYKKRNISDKWQHCWNILRNNNAVIGKPFLDKGYLNVYWIFPEKYQDRIFRRRIDLEK